MSATVKVYESQGADGYTEGTWGYVVTYELSDSREASSGDGGYPSREEATRAAKAHAATVSE